MRHTLHDRLLMALVLSVLMHATLLALPTGNVSLIVGLSDTTIFHSSSSVADLRVLLSPVSLHMSQITTASPIDTPPPLKKASTTDIAEDEVSSSLASTGGGTTSNDSFNDLPIAGIPVPYYYRSDELSQRARVVVDIDPFHDSLKHLPGAGQATLRLWINERGTVDRVETITSSLGDALESAVLAKFQAIHFQPAEIDGVQVKSLMRIQVEVLP